MQIQIPSTQTLDYLKMDDALISTIFCERNRRNEEGGRAGRRAAADTPTLHNFTLETAQWFYTQRGYTIVTLQKYEVYP